MIASFPIGIDCRNRLRFDQIQVPLETAKQFNYLTAYSVRIWFDQIGEQTLEACDFECLTTQKAFELIQLLQGHNQMVQRSGDKVKIVHVVKPGPVLPNENKWLAAAILKPNHQLELLTEQSEFAIAHATLEQRAKICATLEMDVDDGPIFPLPQLIRIKTALDN